MDSGRTTLVPWEILEQNGKHCVAKKGGEVLKCYADKTQATAYLRALYANTHESFTAAAMPAHEFNGRSQVGQRLATRHHADLERKYESAFRAQAMKSRKYAKSLTAAISPDIPEGYIDPEAFKASVIARTATPRKRMVEEVGVSLLGSKEYKLRKNQEQFGILIDAVAAAQADNALLAASDAVHSALLEGLTEGLSVDQTAERVGEIMDEWAPWQARRQAQTDLVSLANGASLTAAQILGEDAPQYKTWLSAGDNRVRPAHQTLDKQVVGINDPWVYEGTEIRYPGDPAAPDGLIINCRCTLIYTDTAEASLAHSLNGGIIEDPLAIAAAGYSESLHPRVHAGSHGGGQWARAQAVDRAQQAKAIRDSFELEEPTVAQKVDAPIVTERAIGTSGISTDEKSKAQRALGFTSDEALKSKVSKAGSWDELTTEERSRLATHLENVQDESDYENLQPLIDKLKRGKVMGLNAAAVDFTSGTMIALYPAGPDRLAAPGGQSETDLHVTLCFLPNGVTGDRPLLVRVLSEIAYQTDVLSGTVGGMGMFAPGPDGAPVIALPDVPGLAEVRQQVVQALNGSGTDYAQNHGFTPHITITYVPEGAQNVQTPDLVGMPLEFRNLSLVEGPDRMDFPFREPDLDLVPGETADDQAIVESMDPSEYLSAAAYGVKDKEEIEEEEPVPDLTETVAVAPIVSEYEDIHFGRRVREPERLDVLLPVEYDSLTASAHDEAAQRREFLNSLATRGAEVLIETESLVAAAVPVHPPKDWFDSEEPDFPMPLTITADGQVMGHAAVWGSCHTGFPGRCTQPPTSPSGYKYFHTGALELADGSTIPVGRLTFDGPHASMTASRAQAAAHYDNTCKVGAYVTAKDGKHGIWITGALKSGLTDADLQSLRAAAPSGDWRRPSPGSPLEMVGILGVNVAGFPVPRSLAASALLEDAEDDKSEVLALVAAGLEDTIHMADAYYERQLEVLGLIAADELDTEMMSDQERRMASTLART